jgi:hypothetical protein
MRRNVLRRALALAFLRGRRRGYTEGRSAAYRETDAIVTGLREFVKREIVRRGIEFEQFERRFERDFAAVRREVDELHAKRHRLEMIDAAAKAERPDGPLQLTPFAARPCDATARAERDHTIG